MRIGKCEKCGAQIMNPRHVGTNRPAPIEVQPSDDGNILVTGTKYEIVPKDEREKVKLRGFVLRKNHFATCDYARSFAKKKPKPTKARAAMDNVITGPWEKYQN
jgi:hypothetical protein